MGDFGIPGLWLSMAGICRGMMFVEVSNKATRHCQALNDRFLASATTAARHKVVHQVIRDDDTNRVSRGNWHFFNSFVSKFS